MLDLTKLNIQELGAVGTFVIVLITTCLYFAYKICKIKCNEDNKKE